MAGIIESDKKKCFRILIVDDSQNNIDYLTSILKRDNYQIASSKNGATAISKAKGNRFDLILLDIVMEGMDGFEVCKELKRYPTTKDVPIIFLTSLSDPQHITKGFEYGAVDFVTKPYNHSELNARVNTHLELKRWKDTIAEKNKQLEDTNKELEKLSLVASKTSNAVIITNAEGDIEWVNDGFTRLLGYTIDEYKRMNGSNFLNSFDNRNVISEIEESISHKKSIIFSNVKLTKAGKGRWFQTTLTPIINSEDEVQKLVAICSDISALKEAEQEIKKKNQELEEEKIKSERLLLNILPYETAEELKQFGKAKVKHYNRATVLFTDFKGFTRISESMTPGKLVEELDKYFIKFDEIIDKHNLEKIKTIGDSYMCAGGIPVANNSNPFDIILAAFEIQSLMYAYNVEQIKNNQIVWTLRLGIHTGELIAGVVGHNKFAYDIWGDTVNTASRMETAGEIGKINISGVTYDIVKDFFEFTYRGQVMVKNKGDIDMYFVNRIKPEFSQNKEGTLPNKNFYNCLKEIEVA